MAKFTVPIEYDFVMGYDEHNFCRCKPATRMLYICLWSYTWKNHQVDILDTQTVKEITRQNFCNRTVTKMLQECIKNGLIEKVENGYKLIGFKEKWQSAWKSSWGNKGKSTKKDTDKHTENILDSSPIKEKKRKRKEKEVKQAKECSPSENLFSLFPPETQKVLKVWSELTAGLPPFSYFSQTEIKPAGDQIQSWCERFGTEKVIDLMRTKYIEAKIGKKPKSLKYFIPIWAELEGKQRKETPSAFDEDGNLRTAEPKKFVNGEFI